MSKYDYVENLYSVALDKNVKGFMDNENIKILEENSTGGQILLGMEYRPDKVAAYYLGDEKLSWAITLANRFTNGIQDYYLGREIKIPNSEAFLKLKRS